MTNIFIEGIQGSGKSTLLNRIAQSNPNLQVCREGDYSPVELAWCTWMNENEYNAVLERYDTIRDEIVRNTFKNIFEGKEYFIVTYTRILTDIPGFHKDLEQYEIYNGRREFEDFKEIIFSRYKNFSEKDTANFAEQNYLFECSFFQNIIETLILYYMLSDEEIVEFYRELYHNVNNDDFKLLYLYSDDIEENIATIRKERCDNQGNELWYELMLKYLIASPYGQQYGYGTFDDMIAHFKHRQDLEMRIIRDIIGEQAIIVPSGERDFYGSFIYS